MARVLKELLANDHPLFLMNIAQLEKASGNSGIDTRLIGEITEKGHALLRELGLDPADTTGKELYQALHTAIRNDAHQQAFRETEFVLLNLGDGPISLNRRDAIENVHHQLAYEHRSVAHAQRKLRLELIRRYAEHERTHEIRVGELAKDAGLHVDSDNDHKEYDLAALHETTGKEDAPYILAVGDIFTDAFIKLNDDEARVTKDDDGKEWLAVQFGAKMPYDAVDIVSSVGPSPNAAVSFSRLGVNAGLQAFLGDDEVGKESLRYLASEGVETSTIRPEAGAKSSYWYVLRYGADRTMLVKNETFAYKWVAPANTPDWIYLSQISDKAWQLHEDILSYLQENPDVKLAFQPGTSQLRWGAEKLAEIYRRSTIVVMNREEAMDVTGKPYDSVRDLANALHELGPHIVVITDGPKGSYASYDYKLVTIPNYPDPTDPYERTGAGDAFASTIVAALALGETMDTALTWAPINSAYVVQKLGAQAGLLHREEIEKYLADAPDWYKVTEFNG